MYEYHAKNTIFSSLILWLYCWWWNHPTTCLPKCFSILSPSFSFPQLNWVTTPQKRFSCLWFRRIFSLSSIAFAVACFLSLIVFAFIVSANVFSSSPGCSLVSGAPVFSFPCPSGVLNVWLRRLKSKSTGIACYVDSLEPCLIFHPEGSSLPTCRTRMFSALLEGYGNGLKNDESHIDGTKMGWFNQTE